MVYTLGNPVLDLTLAGVLGLVVGSFLNVVIHRLPRMLEQRWAQECAQAGHAGGAHLAASAPETLTLAHPPSSCPHCAHAIRWRHNLPVLGWLWLRGRCHDCQARISPRYPLVEAACGTIFVYAAWRWGLGPVAGAWAGLSATLLALALIDWDTTLLPDGLTLPLLWAGLLSSALGWTGVNLSDAVWGAAGGYLFLWTVFHLFRLLTGKDGMGYGDFKLLAALGAWFGWQALLPLVLISSLLGSVAGVTMKIRGQLVEGRYLPYGPWLAAAGAVLIVAGPGPVIRALGI